MTKTLTFRTAAESLLKTWLACAIATLGLSNPNLTLVIFAMMGALALIRGKNPLYLGINKSMIAESRIIKYGLPVVLVLFAGVALIAKCLAL